MNSGITVENLLEERRLLTEKAAPLRKKIADLQQELDATLRDIGPIEALLVSRGWSPPSETTEKSEASGTITDYYPFALEWVGERYGEKITTSEFSSWLEKEKLFCEPSRNSIRNAFVKLENELKVTVLEKGQGRRATIYRSDYLQ